MEASDRAEVRVVVPAAPPFVRLVRLAAADVASRVGFSIDEIDDLRIAVDELCFTLTGQDGMAGSLDVSFQLGDGEVVVHGVARFAEDGRADRVPPPAEISQEILRAVLDDLELDHHAPDPAFRAVKRRAAS